ncbi:MAG: class I SAM-dependent methyltransferase [Pikeienuella sp.]
MTGFSAEWLALRAPADDQARDQGLIDTLLGWVGDRQLRIADLGGGSGAALRALSPVLPAGQDWQVFDYDAALLSGVGDGAETVVADLANSPETAFKKKPELVTGFAFFDLTSGDWIERLADFIAASGAALYAPLTYDGLETWLPTPAYEVEALAAFNRDMQRDKGFGPALGADAAPKLAYAMKTRGYTVRKALSPWRLDRSQHGIMMDALANGGADALATALSEATLAEWHTGRLGAKTAEVGHIDVLALPPG